MNFSKTTVIGLLLLFWVSCLAPPPEYQLTDEQLVKILADWHIGNAAAQHLSVSLKDSMENIYLEQTLEVHNVDRKVFEEDFNQLEKDPEKLTAIYEEVIERLSDLRVKK